MIGFELGPAGLALRGARVTPLLLDFVEGVYRRGGESAASFQGLSGVGFARAGDGTALTSSNGVASFTADIARITNRGLLLETAATNLLARSQTFENAAWSQQNVTVTANAATAPDGATTADRMTPTSGVGYRIGQSVTLSAGLKTASVFVANAGYNFARLALLFASLGGPSMGWYVDVNLTTGAIVTAPTAFGAASTAGLAARVTASSHGFWRIELTCTSAGGVHFPTVGVLNAPNGESFTANGTSGLLLWQADLVAGAPAPSPVVTTTASTTRGADAASVVVPGGVSIYEAVYGEADAVVSGAVTPGATFDLVAGRPWIGVRNELKRLVMR